MARYCEPLVVASLPELVAGEVELFVVRTKARFMQDEEPWEAEVVLANYCPRREVRLQLATLLETFDEAECVRCLVPQSGLMQATRSAEMLMVVPANGDRIEVTIGASSFWIDCDAGTLGPSACGAFVALASVNAPSISVGVDFECVTSSLAGKTCRLLQFVWRRDENRLEARPDDLARLRLCTGCFVLLAAPAVRLPELKASLNAVRGELSPEADLVVSVPERYLRAWSGPRWMVPVLVICA